MVPSDQAALQLRSHVLTLLGELDAAKTAATTLASFYPIDPVAVRRQKILGVAAPPPSREFALKQVLSEGATSRSFRTAATYLYEAGLFEDCIEFCVLGIASIGRDANNVMATSDGELLLRNQQAMALEGLGRYENAIEIYTNLLPSQNAFAKAASGIARCWLELKQPERAEAMMRTVNVGSDDPFPFSPLALDVLQSQGKVAESYRLYRKKPASIALAEFFNQPPASELDLRNMAYKSALFLSEGGPGDELRLCSVYDDLAGLVPDITITCDPRLQAVMKRSFPSITFLPAERYRREIAKAMPDRTLITDAKLYQFLSDRAIEVGRTKELVCSVLDTLADVRPDTEAFRPASLSPLEPIPELRTSWRQQLGRDPGKLQVGLAWRSMLQSVARNRHYLTVDDLTPLASMKDVEFWLLQPTPTAAELERLTAIIDFKIPEGLDLVGDIEGQLALSSCLDAVISPFTTTAELAAAAGTRTAMLSVAQSTMWRRRSDGSDIFRSNAHIFAVDSDRWASLEPVMAWIENHGNSSSTDRKAVVKEGRAA